MGGNTSKPRGGWALIVDALAELGAWELERRQRAAQRDWPGDDAGGMSMDMLHDEPTAGDERDAAEPAAGAAQ